MASELATKLARDLLLQTGKIIEGKEVGLTEKIARTSI